MQSISCYGGHKGHAGHADKLRTVRGLGRAHGGRMKHRRQAQGEIKADTVRTHGREGLFGENEPAAAKGRFLVDLLFSVLFYSTLIYSTLSYPILFCSMLFSYYILLFIILYYQRKFGRTSMVRKVK